MVKRSKFKFMEHVFKIQRIHESTNRLELIDCGFFFGSVKMRHIKEKACCPRISPGNYDDH